MKRRSFPIQAASFTCPEWFAALKRTYPERFPLINGPGKVLVTWTLDGESGVLHVEVSQATP